MLQVCWKGVALSAMVIGACAAGASGQVQVSGVGPGRWGQVGEALGTVGMSVESFEDVTLEPGLAIRWESAAGNAGPVTVLPNLFNPATDDPFGNAFVGGTWSGSRCLVSTRNNQTFPYSSGTNWGDVILEFNPPVRVVAFSVHQADISPNLVVNNINRGALFSLAGLSPASGRSGYVWLTAPGTEVISSVKLDNVSGDGFVLDQVAFSGELPLPITVRRVATWGAPDIDLGVSSTNIEDFEDTTLLPGLEVEVNSLAGSGGPWATLPQAFAPVTQDPFGDAFDPGVWDGSRCLINTRTNAPFPYNAVDNWGDVTLRLTVPRNIVGFSLGDVGLPLRLLVNGRDEGNLLTLAGAPVGARQGYIVIETDDPRRMTSVRLCNGRDGYGDGFVIDHLALVRTCPADFNQDGNADQGDVDYLINVIAGGENPTGRDPDFNEDGNADQGDIDALINVVAGGPCPS